MGCLGPARSRPGMATGRLSSPWSEPQPRTGVVSRPPESSASVTRARVRAPRMRSPPPRRLRSCGRHRAVTISVPQSTGLSPDESPLRSTRRFNLSKRTNCSSQGRQPTRPPGLTSVAQSTFPATGLHTTRLLYDAAGPPPRASATKRRPGTRSLLARRPASTAPSRSCAWSPKRSLRDQPDRRKHSSVRQWTLSLLRLRFRRSMLRCPRITAVSSAVTPRARMSFELPGIDRELAEIGEAWAECVQGPACPIGRVGGDAEPAERDREPSHPDVG